MVEKQNKNVLRIIYGMLIVLTIIYITNYPARGGLLPYVAILVVSLIFYNSSSYQKYLIGITKNRLIRSIIAGGIFSGAFYFVTTSIPGFSLGVPLLPNAISDSLKFAIIVFVAPIAEEIFFRGGVYAFIKEFNTTKRGTQIALVVQAVLFALAHLGAYVSGFYDYSSITEGLSVVAANISLFFSAALFGYIAGFFVTRTGIKNLGFSITAHMLINFLIFGKYSISVFSFVLVLLR